MKKSNIRRIGTLILTFAMLMSLGTAAFAAAEELPATGKAAIQLIDSDGGEPLKVPGAVYALYFYTGTTFDEWASFSCEELYGEYVSDENGLVQAENLPAGEYRWEEVSAPEGYNTTPLVPNYMGIGPYADATKRIYCFKTSSPEEFTAQRIEAARKLCKELYFKLCLNF